MSVAFGRFAAFVGARTSTRCWTNTLVIRPRHPPFLAGRRKLSILPEESTPNLFLTAQLASGTSVSDTIAVAGRKPSNTNLASLARVLVRAYDASLSILETSRHEVARTRAF